MPLLLKVRSSEHGMSLLAFLRARCAHEGSVKSLKRLIDKGRCAVNARIVRISTTSLAAGSSVTLDLLPLASAPPDSLSLLYEDEDVACYDKPAGLVCVPAAFPSSLRLVHRLDKETSGVLLLAKHAEAQRALERLFAERRVRKEYLAIVDGRVLSARGTIDNRLGKLYAYAGQTVYGPAPCGARAITSWRRLHARADATLLLCQPLTGRTHQIRAHMKGAGHPILGDVQYGAHFRCAYRPSRHLLHAASLTFSHPRSGEEIRAEAPLPIDFLEACAQLGLSWNRS
jgi:RluA family pseudouridine synthase